MADEEEVVDGERELLVAERTLGEEQAREDFGGVAEQRAVLVLQRRVCHLRVHVHVVHHPATPASAPASTSTSTSSTSCSACAAPADITVFGGRRAP